MKTVKVLIVIGLMLLGCRDYGLCEEPPTLPLDWLLSHETNCSQKTKDGGYILAGQFWVPGGNQYDFWVLKLKKDGTIDWQKTYGGGDWDIGFATQETSDGGYIVTGTTSSFGAGDNDIWVLKLDHEGNIVWQKTYGGKGSDEAQNIEQTNDGGYIVSGTTSSFGEGSCDIWVLKLSSDGNVVWDRTYGGKDEEGESFRHIPIEHTSDGGYIVAGSTKSFGAGADDLWVLKLSSDGNIEWQKTYGARREEYPTSVKELPNGTYRLTGSEGLGISQDDWILILDSKGNIVGFSSLSKIEITIFDTAVIPKPTNRETTSSSASVTDTTPLMERQKE
jgi:hypothetical protein